MIPDRSHSAALATEEGKAERSVQYVKGNFLATWESVDIATDRAALRRWLEEIASRRVHATTGRIPIELFEEEERAALLVLPSTRWEPVTWKRARVHRDSHVQIDGGFYSAPWRHLHEALWVRCTPASIAIYHEDLLLHTHTRVRRGQRSTVPEHLPDHRVDLRHRSREYWIRRARAIGLEVEELVVAIFASDDVLSQLRKVQAAVTHLETFPRERARAAARRALHFGCTDYRGIKQILRKALDLEPLPGEAKERAWSSGSRFARQPTDFFFS